MTSGEFTTQPPTVEKVETAPAQVDTSPGPSSNLAQGSAAPVVAPASASNRSPYVVVTGNPNCGKTTLFNQLTGLRAKVGNYAGVTVERKEGRLLHAPAWLGARVLDLPGTYSLSPQSLDEQISRDVLLNRLPELPAPAVIVVVVDASNLERNLYYATQVIELAHPTVVALNMIDVAEENGHQIDIQGLEHQLGVPVVATVASTGRGLPQLTERIVRLLEKPAFREARHFRLLPPGLETEVEDLAGLLAEVFHERRAQASAEALLLLSNEKALASSRQHYPDRVLEHVNSARQRLERGGTDWRSASIEGRYARVAEIHKAVTLRRREPGPTTSDKLDKLLTHKLWGTLVFLTLMALVFQSIFTFARIPMDALQSAVDWLGGVVGTTLPPGDLNSLLVDGVIAGVGAVVVFLPQILLLFFFIGFLEDTGYMARAAFLMDRFMSKVGLHGKSFIPMLSSFACAIPGIMATRTIESPKDRLVTILIAPLMSCSARLPVYTLLIAACIPNITVLGFVRLQGLTMFAMYALGATVALGLAWLLKKTLLRAETPLLILELPPYKRPVFRLVVRHMWERSKLFLRQAGTIILGINIVLWFLATYPRSSRTDAVYEAKRAAVQANAQVLEQDQQLQLAAIDADHAGTRLRESFAGRLGHLIEPIIAPLGFDWKIGIGIISSFAAREVFVSSMAIIYNVADDASSDEGVNSLVKTLQAEKRPDGSPMYTTLTALTLMVFYVFALQCVSTVAVVRRETNSWRWPLFQWLVMACIAWGCAFAVWRVGHLFGYS